MKTPSIPASFWTAIATAILGTAAAYGLPVSAKAASSIMTIATVLPVALLVCGTILHATRAVFADKVVTAKAVQAQADAAVAALRAEARAATPEQKAIMRRILSTIVSAIVARMGRTPATSTDASSPA